MTDRPPSDRNQTGKPHTERSLTPKTETDGTFTPWDNDVRIKVVQEYMRTGNMSEVERLTKVPYTTLRMWKKTKWWDEYVRSMRGERDIAISNRVESMLSRTYDALEERLQAGDSVYNPHTGELIKIPVKAQVLNAISANLAKQRIELANQPTESQMHDKDATAAKLAELADAFASFVKGKRQPQITIEHEEPTDAIFEGREA